ncbi:MAG: hypothetical protein RL685_5200 [Pseudomonadota bacterium]
MPSSLRHPFPVPFLPVLLSVALSCAPTAHAPAAAPAVAAPAPSAALPAEAAPPAELTPARQQLESWLEAFNSGQRSALLAYHERHFPYAAASADVRDIEREHGLSLGTQGFELRRIEESSRERLVALLKERRGPQHARVTLQVAAEPPHAVTKFNIGPVPTPLESLTQAEGDARKLDASSRALAIETISRQLQDHYVFPETAAQVIAALQRKQARGDYDAITDAVELAGVLTLDLRRLARDKHLSLRFGPVPPQPDLSGSAPPWLAQSGYGFGAIERLEGNVALLTLNGFPPLFAEQRAAIGERMSQIADAAAVIVDLRNNGGGFPPTVLEVCSYFFDPEPVHLIDIYRRDTNHTNEHWTQRELPGRRFGSQKPVFILTGPRTFSGGEGFAYQLQTQNRAVVVGESTGGGAHPSQPYPVEGGFVLMVPWGRSISPVTGTNWEGIGVLPDVAVPADDALPAAQRLALQWLGGK